MLQSLSCPETTSGAFLDGSVDSDSFDDVKGLHLSHQLNEKESEDGEDHGHGVEAEPLGESWAVLYATENTKLTNDEFGDVVVDSRGRGPSPSLPPMLRSPVVGDVVRTLGEISPMQRSSSDISGDGSGTSSPMLCQNLEHGDRVFPRVMTRNGPNLDKLLDRFEVGVPVIFHDGSNPRGTNVVLSIVDDHSYICVSPVRSDGYGNGYNENGVKKGAEESKGDDPTTIESISAISTSRLAVSEVGFLSVGKKSSSILSLPTLLHVHPMLCFSIVSTSGKSFDFEAQSVLERETIVSSLTLMLDTVHMHNENRHGRSEEPLVAIPPTLCLPLPDPDNNDANRAHNSHDQGPQAQDIRLSPSNRAFIYNPNPMGPQTQKSDLSGTESTPLGTNPNPINTTATTTSENSVIRRSNTNEPSPHWCSQFCAMALQDITEVCTDLLSAMTEVGRQGATNLCCDRLTNGDACLSGFFGCFGFEEAQTQRRMLEYNILGILGTNSQVAAWFEGHLWSLEENYYARRRKAIEGSELPRVLRNRAAVLNAQAKRLRQLRNEMTFFAAVKTATQNMRWVESTKSMDDDLLPDNPKFTTVHRRVLTKPKRKSATTAATKEQDAAATDFTSYALCRSAHMSLVFTDEKVDEEDTFYDSDPGEMRCRHSKCCSRRMAIEALNKMHDSVVLDNFATSPHSDPRTKKIIKPILKRENGRIRYYNQHDKDDSSVASHRTCDSLDEEQDSYIEATNHDDEYVSEFIKEITNETMTFVWHPTQNAQQKKSPICVNAWIELGSRLRDSFVQPKLMWRAAYEPALSKRQLNVSERVPDSVELLDICRILHAGDINREMHPFAKKSSSFLVETSSDVFLFEARNEGERDWIVHGLKLLVARLASQLIVGDAGVYEEFFTPGGHVLEVGAWPGGGDGGPDILLTRESHDDNDGR